MRARGFLPLILALGFVIAAAVPRAAYADQSARAFMQDVSNHVLAILNDKQRSDAEREKQFEALVDQNFDLPRISRFVLGLSWRTASDQEKQQFNQAFRTYLIDFYWGRFRQYSGQSFKVIGEQAQSPTLTIVNTQIVQPSGQPPAKVDWTVIKEGGGYKIIDVSIEGISQVLTYRQEFAAVIQRNDGDVGALINAINQKIKG
jgi:phospholipid transport system substrate-binding protein